MDILQILVKNGIILQKDVDDVADESAKSGLTIEEVLLKRGVSVKDILSAKGEYFDIPIKSLDEQDVPLSILNYIPEDSAAHYRFVPIKVTDNVLEIGKGLKGVA